MKVTSLPADVSVSDLPLKPNQNKDAAEPPAEPTGGAAGSCFCCQWVHLTDNTLTHVHVSSRWTLSPVSVFVLGQTCDPVLLLVFCDKRSFRR